MYRRVFKVGMQCIDEYKDQCLNQRHKIQMERAVAGAQHTFAFLCDDPVFQSGKLKNVFFFSLCVFNLFELLFDIFLKEALLCLR